MERTKYRLVRGGAGTAEYWTMDDLKDDVERALREFEDSSEDAVSFRVERLQGART